MGRFNNFRNLLRWPGNSLPGAKDGMGTRLTYRDYKETLNSDLKIAEAFSALLNRVAARSKDDKKVVLITSTQPNEGKTTVVINLAIANIFAGRKVLVIDGDLRRPMIHAVMQLENKIGLSDVLSGRADGDAVTQFVDIVDDGASGNPLAVIPSGAVSPEIVHTLGMPHVRTLLHELAEGYDLVLIDTSPSLAVNDPVLLSSAVDGIIFVLNAGVIKESEARRAQKLLEETGTPLLGAVLNRFDEREHGGGLYPYRAYYGYYGYDQH